MVRSIITGTGISAADRVIKNQYFNELYGKDVDTFLRRDRNIFERRFMSEGQATSDLILPAAREALENAGLTAEDLDLIIVATDTPDYLSPATASVVQFKLGAKRAATFDVNSACAGFVTALDVGNKFIVADDRFRRVLVVGAYGMSRYLNMDDYKVATVFADGAGAVVLQATTNSELGIQASHFYADGSYHDATGIYGGGTFRPITPEVLACKSHLLAFPRKIPSEFNSTHWPQVIRALLDRVNARPSDVACYFFTQINIGSIHDALQQLGVPQDRAHNIMDRYGYTGSACVPMAMADAARQGRLKKNDLVISIASGGGVSLAAVALRWAYDTKKVAP